MSIEETTGSTALGSSCTATIVATLLTYAKEDAQQSTVPKMR